MREIVSMCYLSDYKRGKGYSVVVAEYGMFLHPAELGKNYLKAVEGLAKWAEANGYIREKDAAVWFKYKEG